MWVHSLLKNHNCVFSGMNKTKVKKMADVFSPSRHLRGSVTLTPLISTWDHSHPPSSPLSLSHLLSVFLYFFFHFEFSYDVFLYKVFKILFVLYDVSMVMFFIKEEEKFIFVTGLFHNSFLNWYCKISMQELLSGAFLFKNVICVINGRIWMWLPRVYL